MMPGSRGWKRIPDMRPARDVDIRYGSGLVLRESAGWPDHVVVATGTAWKVASAYSAREAAGVGVVEWLDWDHLDEVTDSLPDSAELLVGIGGGVALDASKYVALRKDLPLVLVPTIVSTGAIIHGTTPRWKGRVPVEPFSDWPFCDCEHVLVDYGLVLEAPSHLNTAGIGDVLCGFGGIAEWRYAAGRGEAPAVDAGQVESVLEFYREIVRRFTESLTPDGSLTGESVKLITWAIQERDDRSLQGRHVPAADHVIHHTIERVCDRGLVHGEMTALGSVIVSWATGQHEEHLERLDRCLVRYRPAAMGLTKDELRRSLAALPDDLGTREVDSILGREPVVGARFDELWKFLEAL